MDRTTYKSIEECSKATGIPYDILLLARNHKDSPKGTHGFADSYRVYWNTPNENNETLEQWINAHLDELTNADGESKHYWDTRGARARALANELELEQSYKKIVKRKSVQELLERVGLSLVSLFNAKLRQELPARLNLSPEQIVEIDKILADLFAIIQKDLREWK